jgi:ribosomal protein L40E
MSDLDSIFKAQADRAEQEERDRAANRGRSFTFEKIKWTGLETGKMKVVRAIGEAPDWHLSEGIPTQNPYDARVVRIARVVDDAGKQMRVILPLRDRNEDYILWRIIDRVNEVEWLKDVNNKSTKIFVNKEKHPDIFNIVNFNNLAPDNPQRKFGLPGKGWMGKEYFVMNVIDRAMLAWHKENKHTVLLSKNVNIKKGDDGKITEYVEEGVPAFGFTNNLLQGIVKYYGFWEKYDIGIEKTGLQTSPTRVINAFKLIEQVPADLQPLVSNEPLTDEERSWERYDISKLFQVTSYTKLWNKLKLTIAKIDSAFKTHYLDELKELADKEAAERKEKSSDESEDEVPVEAPAQKQEEAPVERKSTVAKTTTVTDLPGYKSLNEKDKALIASVSLMTDEEKAVLDSKATSDKPVKYGQYYKIVYKTTGNQGICPDCGAKSPTSFDNCPVCGIGFTF